MGFNGGDYQVWELEPTADGFILLKDRATQRYLCHRSGDKLITEYYSLENEYIVWKLTFEHADDLSQGFTLKNKATKMEFDFNKLEKIERDPFE
jgi:hypothetical protein